MRAKFGGRFRWMPILDAIPEIEMYLIKADVERFLDLNDVIYLYEANKNYGWSEPIFFLRI